MEYVGEAVKRCGIKVQTYCLMTMHYHLLIESIMYVQNSESAIRVQGDRPEENPVQ